MFDVESCEAILFTEAERLSAQCDLPVPAAEISRRLGVRLRRTVLKGAKALLVNAESSPEILLPSGPSDSGLSVWERFIVAHELGHVIMHRASIPKPLGESEYWKHEHLCDAFARWLLIPKPCLSSYQEAFEDGPDAKLNLVLHLEKRAKVPWAVAAYRIAEFTPNLVFLGLVLERGRLKVNVSTLPQKKERGRVMKMNEKLPAALNQIEQRRSAQPLSIHDLSSLPTLAPLAVSAAAVKESDSQFRIAIKTLSSIEESSQTAALA